MTESNRWPGSWTPNYGSAKPSLAVSLLPALGGRKDGYPTTFQTVTPGLFLRFEKLIKPLVAASLPPTRPEDNVPIGADLPQEEEYALGNLCPFSFYNGWCFPQNMEFYYNYVLMENVPKQHVEEWKKTYLQFIKKVTEVHHGKQLCCVAEQT